MATKIYFNDTLNDTIVERAEAFFPDCVTVDVKASTITIRDKILIVIHCNPDEDDEYKVLINTFENVVGDIDLFMKLNEINPSFCLYGITDMCKYLNIKSNENQFIKKMAG